MIKRAIKLAVLGHFIRLAYNAAGYIIAGVLGTLMAAGVLSYFVFAVKSGWIVLE